MTLHITILAAGKGTRMCSSLPKVLHPLASKPMLGHVLDTAKSVLKQETGDCSIVCGYAADVLQKYFPDPSLQWIFQAEPLGTGHAVQQVISKMTHHDRLLVLAGDVPLLSAQTLLRLIHQTPPGSLGILTAQVNHTHSLGRVVRDVHNQVVRIVESADASDAERKISEIYAGVLIADVALLQKLLPRMSSHNAQGEWYLTEVIALANAEDIPIVTVETPFDEVRGVNNQKELSNAERIYQRNAVEKLQEQGVHVLDPARLDIRGTLTVEQNVTLDVGVIIEGNVFLGEGTYVGPYSVISDSTIGKHVNIKSHSVIESAVIADHCSVGPFARLRPGTQLASEVKVGNFVEIKKSQIGKASKVNHLSYIGDATIGAEANIGAGTITCNYDGVNKHQTIIEDGAFIGSNSALVAPVTIGKDAVIGAGSVITKSAPAGQLTVARAVQKTVKAWFRKK